MTARKSPPEPGAKPQFLVVEDNLHYQSKRHGEIVLNLDFPFKIMLDAMDKSEEEADQFVTMLEALGDTQTIRKVKDMGSLEAMRLIRRFFAEFEKAAGADSGKSESSSDS